MNRVNKEIRDQYEFYTDLVKEKKIVKTSPILLEPRTNNIYWLRGQSDVEHSTVMKPMTLIVERSKRENKYGVKLRCTTLVEEPFIRFDSDGPAHRNDDPKIPLDEQIVTTPHFNGFNSDGKPFAYKTEALKNAQESSAIVNDINFGVSHFCSETNSNLDNDGFPEILDKSPELELKEEVEVDIFRSISFE